MKGWHRASELTVSNVKGQLPSGEPMAEGSPARFGGWMLQTQHPSREVGPLALTGAEAGPPHGGPGRQRPILRRSARSEGQVGDSKPAGRMQPAENREGRGVETAELACAAHKG